MAINSARSSRLSLSRCCAGAACAEVGSVGGCSMAGSSIFLREKREQFFLNCAGDARLFFTDIDVHFAANTKFRKIDAGLDGGTSTGNQMTNVVRFDSVHISAVAMNGSTDVVAGAMEEIFPETGFFNDPARGIVHLPALKRLPFCDAREDEID